MNKSSKASVNNRKARYAWRPTGVANVYMRGTKYYYVKMSCGKRHFVPLVDSQGRPVLDLAEAIRAASKVAMNPFVEDLSRCGTFSASSSTRSFGSANGKRRQTGPSSRTKHLSQVSQNRSVQLPLDIFRNGTTSSAPASLITRQRPTSRALRACFGGHTAREKFRTIRL